MDEIPFIQCNLTKLPHGLIPPSAHIYPKLIHFNQDPLSLGQNIYEEKKYLKGLMIQKR